MLSEIPSLRHHWRTKNAKASDEKGDLLILG